MKKHYWLILLAIASALCFALGLGACAKAKDPVAHNHTYDAWDYDETQHWKYCDEHGTDKSNIDETTRAPHDFTKGDCICGAKKPVTPGGEQGGGEPGEPCAVQFDVNGGYPIVAFTTCEAEKTISAPQEPKKNGYRFGGWFTDVGCSHEASFPYTVTKDVTFYAKWTSVNKTEVKFRIVPEAGSFTTNGDMIVDGKVVGASGDKLIDYSQDILPPMEIERGSKFEQPENPKDITYQDEDGNAHTLRFSYWTFSSVYEYNISTAVLFPLYDTDYDEITLNAVYIEVRSNQTYAQLMVHPENGEKDTVMYGLLHQELPIATLNANTPYPFQTDGYAPRKAGYEATGYYKTREFTAENIYPVPFRFEKEQNDVYIRWAKKDDVQITFDFGYDNKKEISTTQYRGYVSRIDDPIRVGYTFDGWYAPYTPANEDNVWDFSHDTVWSSFTLKAKWIKTAAVVTFDSLGGEARNPIAVQKGSVINSLPLVEREEDGGNTVYNFLGWYLDEEGSRPALSGTGLTVNDDITLYAKWSDKIDISKLELRMISSGYTVSVKKGAEKELQGVVLLPTRYKGKEVMRVDNSGFAGCTNLTEIVLPETIYAIFSEAFKDCTSLTRIVLPNGLEQIAAGAFENCTELENINFPTGDGFAYIQADIFATCPKMLAKLTKDVWNGVSVFYWEKACLGVGYGTEDKNGDGKAGVWDVTDLTDYTVKEGTTVVASGAFYYCSKLTSLTFSDSVMWASESVFPTDFIYNGRGGCVLTELHLSASYRYSQLAPNYPANLETLTIPASNPYFEVVDGCLVYKPEKILVASVVSASKIPDGIVIIGEESFRNKQLDTVEIPETVTTIRTHAFDEGAYTSIIIPDNVGILDAYAFTKCSNLQSLTLGAKAPLMETAFFTNIHSYDLANIEISAVNENMICISSIVYNRRDGDMIYGAPAYVGPFTPWEKATRIKSSVLGGHYTEFWLPDNIEEVEDSLIAALEVDKLILGKRWGSSEDTFEKLFGNNRGGRISMNLCKEIQIYDDGDMVVKDGAVYNKDVSRLLFVESGTENLVIPDTVTSVAGSVEAYNVRELTVGAGISFDEFIKFIYGYESSSTVSSGCGAAFYPEKITVSEQNAEISSFRNVVYSKDRTSLVYIPAKFDGDLILPKEMTSIHNLFSLMTSSYGNGIIYDEEWDEFYLDPSFVHIHTLSVEKDSQLKTIGAFTFAPASVYYPTSWFGELDWSDGLDLRDGKDGDEAVKFVPDWTVDAQLAGITFQIDKIDLSNATNLKEIHGKAFFGLETLREVILPDSITSYGWLVFGVDEWRGEESALESITGGNFANAEFWYDFINDYTKLCDENGFFIVDGVLLGYRPKGAPTEIVLPEGVTSIREGVFKSCSSLEKIYYSGTQEDWDKMQIGADNSYLTSAIRYYFSLTKPSEEQWTEWDHWWHFDETGKAVEWVKIGT